jgi:hypothetical protein
VVGTVDAARDFDRRFRPTSARVRERWERLALAQRQGVSMPPIDVFRVGDMHFIRDGHHRVSIAMARGETTIDAFVTEIRTSIPAGEIRSRGDLVLKGLERLFLARVPLPAPARARIEVSDPESYAHLSEAVEAWGFRWMQHEGRFCDRAEVAGRWFADEYVPVVKMLGDGELIGSGTETDAYLRVADQRYQLMRTHEWNDAVIHRLHPDRRHRR